MEYKKLFTMSFDDGVLQDERFISILNKYGIRATFNLNSGFLGSDGHLIINDKTVSHGKVNASDVSKIYSNHEVASHTLTHPMLPDLSDEEIIYQVNEDVKNLSSLVSYKVRGFAYPGGGVNCNQRVAQIIKDNTSVEYARTTVCTYNFDLQDNMYLFNPTVSLLKDKDRLISLAKEFIELQTDETKLFYVWGHAYELDINDDWAFFEEFCQLISNKSDILYCTNIQAFDYINKK